MKMTKSLKYLLGAFLLGTVITACDKFEEDVPPARMASLMVNDDNYTTNKNLPVQLNVLVNDTIGGNATLEYSQPIHGTIQTNASGATFYQPDNNFIGLDSLIYKACLDNNCATAKVKIRVLGDTTATCVTQAFDDVRSIMNAGQGAWDTISVLRNDLLCGNSTNNVTIVQQPAHGQASVNQFNQIEYFSALNYIGTDEITYAISNSNGHSTAKVRYNITVPPCAVKANPDSASFFRVLGTIDTVSIKMLANDQLCLGTIATHAQLVSHNTNNGSLMLVGTMPNMRIIYTTNPSAGKNYTDVFQYRVCRGGVCSTTNVNVYVR